jgi:hypothetical protein
MKVIFLDNDGVICLYSNWGGRQKKWSRYRSANPYSSKFLKDAPVFFRFDDFDKKAVSILNSILKETGAEIVVSSDWKLHATLKELGDYYESQGFIKRPIDVTSNHYFGKYQLEMIRCSEIKEWLGQHPEVTHWVAVDDLDLGEKFTSVSGNSNGGLSNFVLTPSPDQGIKQSGIKYKILKFLF